MLAENLMARNLMTMRVETVSQNESLADAVALMDRGGYGQIPVVNGKRPVALLTEADARRAIMQKRQDQPILEIASPLPTLLKPKAPLSDIQAALETEESLLVVSSTGNLIGIITYWDVLKLARPFLLVAEVELMLREVTAAAYEHTFGRAWWDNVRPDLRSRAEEEHEHDAGEYPTPDGEHMLGHMSMWSLIEAFKDVRPELPESRFQELHDVRQLRNQVAHHYHMDRDEIRLLVRTCLSARDWLASVRHKLCR